MTAHLISNTNKDYKCTHCGSVGVSVVRQDSVNPRLKCNTCSFVFNAKDSEAAELAGAIKESSKEVLEAAETPETTINDYSKTNNSDNRSVLSRTSELPKTSKIPITPKYVFIDKKRTKTEFCTEKQFRKVAMKWELEGNYDVYELFKWKFDIILKLGPDKDK